MVHPEERALLEPADLGGIAVDLFLLEIEDGLEGRRGELREELLALGGRLQASFKIPLGYHLAPNLGLDRKEQDD